MKLTFEMKIQTPGTQEKRSRIQYLHSLFAFAADRVVAELVVAAEHSDVAYGA